MLSGAAATPAREQALAIYRTMLLIRCFEERVAECFAAGEIPGLIHLSTGQEAVAATVGALLRPDDLVSATHRGHGQCLAKGAEPARVMAELFGRATGCCRGKGGSMHLCDLARGVLGTNGVVGANLPIAVGTALGASDPVLGLTLVHARTPAAPQDTVRVVSTGRGRHSHSRGLRLTRGSATLPRIPSALRYTRSLS
jgi:hypothetical protein